MIRRIRRPSSSAAALLSQTADGMELGISSVHSRNESSIVAKSFDDEGGSLQLKQFRSQVDGMRSQHDEEAPPAPAPAEAPAAPADWLKRNYRRGSAILAPILNSPLQGQPSVKTLSSAAMLQALHLLHPLHPLHTLSGNNAAGATREGAYVTSVTPFTSVTSVTSATFVTSVTSVTRRRNSRRSASRTSNRPKPKLTNSGQWHRTRCVRRASLPPAVNAARIVAARKLRRTHPCAAR